MRKLLMGLILLAVSLGAGAEPMSFPGFVWNSPVKFGEIQELGPDAYFANYPADAETEKAQFQIVVISTPRDSVMAMREAGADAGSLALSTFLELSGKPIEINKALFMEETVARRVWACGYPRANRTHVLQTTLDDGGLITVALRDYGGHAAALTGDIITALGNTFASSSD